MPIVERPEGRGFVSRDGARLFETEYFIVVDREELVSRTMGPSTSVTEGLGDITGTIEVDQSQAWISCSGQRASACTSRMDACCDFISSICPVRSAVSQLPLKLYRLEQNGKREAVEHPLFEVLHDLSNPEMTAYELPVSPDLAFALVGFEERRECDGCRNFPKVPTCGVAPVLVFRSIWCSPFLRR